MQTQHGMFVCSQSSEKRQCNLRRSSGAETLIHWHCVVAGIFSSLMPFKVFDYIKVPASAAL